MQKNILPNGNPYYITHWEPDRCSTPAIQVQICGLGICIDEQRALHWTTPNIIDRYLSLHKIVTLVYIKPVFELIKTIGKIKMFTFKVSEMGLAF